MMLEKRTITKFLHNNGLGLRKEPCGNQHQ